MTSSIIVVNSLLSYGSGVYTVEPGAEPLGMIDVTIIGWGTEVGGEKYWWVIPHFGCDFGISLGEGFPKPTGSNCDGDVNGGFMKIRRNHDDLFIETNAVGAVPFNFIPYVPGQ